MVVTRSFPFFTLVLACCTLFVSLAQAIESERNNDNAFSLGIVPQQSAKKVLDLWSPLTKYLQQQTNYPFYVHSSPNIPTFENRLFIGKFDLAYVNPRTFIEANQHAGYLPLAREGEKKLKGIIVVSKDSSYKSLTDINGLHFVSPDNAFAASTLTRLSMQSLGLKLKNSFVSTHTQSYALVANGAVDAAGGVMRTFDSLDPEVKNRLRILWTSTGVTPHAFVINPRVNSVVRQRILDALLSFYDTEEGKLFYEALHLSRFVKAQSKDWNDVRQLMGLEVQ